MLKLLSSNDVSISQLEKQLSIVVTFEVSKFFKSKEVNLIHFLNILYIVFRDEVLKLLKFNEVILEQP